MPKEKDKKNLDATKNAFSKIFNICADLVRDSKRELQALMLQQTRGRERAELELIKKKLKEAYANLPKNDPLHSLNSQAANSEPTTGTSFKK